MPEDASMSSGIDWRELVVVVVLSVTAIATAWTGFQASKWGGAMSISFSKASSARIEAARLDGAANRRQTIQVSLFTQWLAAYQNHDSQLTTFLEARFPEPLATAFPVWIKSQPLTSPGAAATPFELPEYAIPEQAQSAAADARADAEFAQALDDNQRGQLHRAHGGVRHRALLCRPVQPNERPNLPMGPTLDRARGVFRLRRIPAGFSQAGVTSRL